MTVIRLTRMGRKKQPFYRIAVTDSRKRRDGGWIELIGHYNPMNEEKTLVVGDGANDVSMFKYADNRVAFCAKDILKKYNEACNIVENHRSAQ